MKHSRKTRWDRPEPPGDGMPGRFGIPAATDYEFDDAVQRDPNQVYVAGSSSGAQMAQRVGVDISDLVAGS